MKIAKLGNRWTVDIPEDVVTALHVNDGDEVSFVVNGSKVEIVKSETIEDTIARIREMRRPLPPGWKFDREEANRRGPE